MPVPCEPRSWPPRMVAAPTCDRCWPPCSRQRSRWPRGSHRTRCSCRCPRPGRRSDAGGGHGRRAVAAYLAPAPPWSPGRDGTRPRAAACRPSRAGQRGTRGESAWGVCRLVAAPGLAGGTRGGAGRRRRHDGGHPHRGRSGAAGRGRSGHRSRGRGGHGTPTQVMSWPSGLIERTRLRWKNTVRDVWR